MVAHIYSHVHTCDTDPLPNSGPMRGLSAALVGAGVVLVSISSAFLVRIWLERRSFDMAARSPVLVVFVGVASLIMAVLVLLHWFLLLKGQGLGLPCYATYTASYFCEFPAHDEQQVVTEISTLFIDHGLKHHRERVVYYVNFRTCYVVPCCHLADDTPDYGTCKPSTWNYLSTTTVRPRWREVFHPPATMYGRFSPINSSTR